MSSAPKKPSRQKTLDRLETVSRLAVGDKTALDAAFEAFETADSADPEAMAQAQAVLRALLAQGLGPHDA